MDVYNKNRDQNRSLHDEIREQNAKLKDASLKEKYAYFKEYYLKTTVFIIIAAVFVFHLAYSILTAPDDTAFAAYFYNSTGDYASTELIDGFIEHIALDTKKHEAYIDCTMTYSPDGASPDAYMGIEKTMAVISTSELDIIVGDAATIDYFSMGESFHDITTVLPDDLLAQFEDKLYYAKLGESEELIPVGIYITDAPKLNQYYYYVNKEPILGFIANSNSMENAIEFLRYIYTE